MTWSIVARDAASGAFGVVVSTKALASGGRCPWVRAGVGAVSTQAITNHYLGPAILDRLADGIEPATAIEQALATDAGRSIRQVHCVDRLGRTATLTGGNCVMWCGHRRGENASVAGNMLAGEDVVRATYDCFNGSTASFAERLLEAMDAGQASGGDSRSARSAALLIATTDIIPAINLRVDDHDTPLVELKRLLTVWRKQIEPMAHWSPSPSNPSGFTDLDAIEAVWRANGLELRFRRGEQDAR